MNDDWSGGWFDEQPTKKVDSWSDDDDFAAPKQVVKKRSTTRKDDWDNDWDDTPSTVASRSTNANSKASSNHADDDSDWNAAPQQARSTRSPPASTVDDWDMDEPANPTPNSLQAKASTTIQPHKTGRKRKVEPLPDAFAIRSTKGRARSNRRRQQAEAQAEAQTEDVEEETKEEEEDDFFGTPAAPKQHERRHVDAALDDFDRVSDNATQQKDEGGSFWDEKEDDFWNSSAPTSAKKVDSTVDRILDDFGNLFQIKVSDNVHENVKKGADNLMKMGSSLWGSFTSLLGEEYKLNLTFVFDGKEYRAKKKLAEGGFSVVYLACDASEREFAVKVMNGSSPSVVKEIEREIKLLKMLKHPNIMPLLGVSKRTDEGAPQYSLLTPFYKDGSVWDEIEKLNADPIRVWTFTEERCLRIFLQVCRAVKVLHDKGLVHRDIKPHNVMLQREGGKEKAILIDFGSVGVLDVPVRDRRDASTIKEDAEKHCSAAYRAPELYDPRPGMNIDGGVDIWALGCTLYAMAFGTCPFESPVEGIMKLAILDANVSFPKNNTYHCCSFSNPFCKFIRMMLRLDIEARITIDDCIEKTQLLIEHCPKQEVY
ncbi:hypothetical protein WA577_006846, partial [Blastocystis sp. JDR]